MIQGFSQVLGALGVSRFSLSLSQKKRDTEQEQELHFIAKETSMSEKEMVTVHHHIFF